MSMVAIIPIANILSANDLLNNVAQTPGKKSHGPNNFSVPAIERIWGARVLKTDIDLFEALPCIRAGLFYWIDFESMD